jgi:hypothetical protein
MNKIIKIFLLALVFFVVVFALVYKMMWKESDFTKEQAVDFIKPVETSGALQITPNDLPEVFGKDFPRPAKLEGFKAQMERVGDIEQYTWFFVSEEGDKEKFKNYLSKNGFSEVSSFVIEGFAVSQYRRGDTAVRLEFDSSKLQKQNTGQIVFTTNVKE